MTSLSDLPIRDDLRGREPYGAPQKHVRVELNVNENTHPIPDEVQADVLARLANAVAGANRYPDREFVELRDALAAYLGHGLNRDNLWAANGSNEILQQLLQAFGGPGRTVLGFAPTYSMYPLLASGTGTEWIAGDRDVDFELSAVRAVEWVRRTQPDVVILCSPNNPTGTPLGLDVVEAVYDAAPGIVIVDEAYAEFFPAGEPSAITLLPGRERLVVSRTMSKAFAYAGVRLGYLAADPAIADALRLVRLPYHLSALTQAAALGALAHAPEMLAMVDEIKVQRDRIVAGLGELGFHPYRTWSNFVLFDNVANPREVFDELLAEGIIIREMGIPNSLRVSAGTASETGEFLDAMARYVARHGAGAIVSAEHAPVG
ncbi:histidinol-phosphate transaminase [Gryllotalpicola koreensis]|uniref:Histidinol-phosphate aminotransferase n=1 Tax=Gryllotalpicola koreensis TaxID=993086 RepID=A0ABP8ABQ9_9MICO